MSVWRAGAEGVTVMVKVHPGSRHPGLRGVQGSMGAPRLKIAATEPAEGGKVNRAVCAMVHRPQSSVQVVAGAANSEKSAAVMGDSTVLVELPQSL